MPELTGDYAGCRRRLLERLQEPAPGRIQLLTGPRQVGKTTLLLRSRDSSARPLYMLPVTSPMRRFPASGNVAGLKLRIERDAERLFCSLMKSIAWATGQADSRASGIFSGVAVSLSMSSRLDRRPYVWSPGRAKAWQGVSNA